MPTEASRASVLEYAALNKASHHLPARGRGVPNRTPFFGGLIPPLFRVFAIVLDCG